MHFPELFAIHVLVFSLIVSPQVASAQWIGFRFLATGDVPYSADQESKYRRLLKQSESEDFSFLMHVGDFKAGNAPCSDDEFLKIRNLFSEYPKPVVYTPGDNEWTDCHTVDADPMERLGKLRQLFFKDRSTLRLHSLNAVSQSRDPKFARYEENYRFSKEDVEFIVAHIVGSNNNHRPDHPPSMAEFNDRNAANLAFLRESFAEAIARDRAGVVVVIHANPDFEKGKQASFQDFQDIMREFLAKYHKPVVCIHGDSHYFRIDKPFRAKSGATFMHFTRLEVFGSPNVAAVAVTVNSNDPQVFSFRPYYLNDQQK